MVFWYILWSYGLFYGRMVYFMVVWFILWSFLYFMVIGIFCGLFVYFPTVLVYCTKKNLATLELFPKNKNVFVGCM
jgi:hypothetical protein